MTNALSHAAIGASLLTLATFAEGAVTPSAGAGAAGGLLPPWVIDPPTWVTWVSLFGGSAAFVWNCFEHFVARKDRRADRKVAVETFWFESVIVPRAIEPLLTFFDQQSNAFVALSPDRVGSGTRDHFRSYLLTCQKQYASLVPQLRLLRVLDVKVHGEISKILDELDDKISLTCFRASEALKKGKSAAGEIATGSGHFSEVQSQCVEKLKNLHHATILRK